MAAAPGFWQRRVVAPITTQLRQGITPEKIALTLSLGLTLGVFPILGATTLMCAVVAFRLQLNQPVIQTVNYFVYPVQILLLLPFYRAGESLFQQPPVPITDIAELVARFQAGPWQFMLDYGMVGLYGVVVWCLTAPIAAALLYFSLLPLLKRLSRSAKKPA